MIHLPLKDALAAVGFALLASTLVLPEAHSGRGEGRGEGRARRSHESFRNSGWPPLADLPEETIDSSSRHENPFTALPKYFPKNKEKKTASAKERPAQVDEQTWYFKRVASFYQFAASKSLAVGVVATAEGLGQLGDEEKDSAKAQALVAAGLQSIAAGEQMKQAEQDTLSKVQEKASEKTVDEELINDPIAAEVLENLAQRSGYSRAQVMEKILNSRGSLDALAGEFENAAAKKPEIETAGRESSELDTLLEGTKAGQLRKKISYASLRETLANSSAMGSVFSGDAISQVTIAGEPEAIVPASAPPVEVEVRAPASQPELLNLGENLPSFELEQSGAEETAESSLFEQVRRKYTEIGPAMTRPSPK